MNDIAIFETGNGGDFVLQNDFQLSSGLFNNIYLCLFGGNILGSTEDAVLTGEERNDWWGNNLFYPNSPNVQFNSRFERALREVTLNSSGRSELENIARRDLQSLAVLGDIDVSAILSGNDKLELRIVITQKNTNIPEQFLLVWNQTRAELIVNRII